MAYEGVGSGRKPRGASTRSTSNNNSPSRPPARVVNTPAPTQTQNNDPGPGTSYTTPLGQYQTIDPGYTDSGALGSPYVAPTPPPPPNKEEWIGKDPGYTAQVSALAKALTDYQTNYDKELGQYDVDYKKGVRTLGWDATAFDDPKTQANEGAGAWNLEDQTRSSGRSYQGQLNDYASRNLLQSSLYAQAVSDLMRSLDEQFGNINTSRQNFYNDKGRALTSYKTDNESQKNLAYADAASRYAAMFGV